LIGKLVKNGLEVSLRVQGQRVHPYKGKIIFVDNTVDPTTSTVLVKAEVPNPDQTLLPGEYVKVDVNLGDFAGVIVVPDEAVVEAQEGARVQVVDDQNKVQAAIVKPLDTYQGLVALESGLKGGEKVIVKGIQLVRPGQTVDTEEADLETFNRPESSAELADPLSSPLIRIRGDQPAETAPAPDAKNQGTGPVPGKSAPAPAPAGSNAPAAPERGS
jgi:hypothetical protein